MRAVVVGPEGEPTVADVPEPDGTRVTIGADARGPMAFTYRMSVTDRTQALIYVAMLDALSSSVRA